MYKLSVSMLPLRGRQETMSAEELDNWHKNNSGGVFLNLLGYLRHVDPTFKFVSFLSCVAVNTNGLLCDAGT